MAVDPANSAFFVDSDIDHISRIYRDHQECLIDYGVHLSSLTFTRDEAALTKTISSLLKPFDGVPSEHTIEQINDALQEVPNDRIFFPLPIPWFFAATRVTIADQWRREAESSWYLKRPWFVRIIDVPHDSWTVVAEWFAIEVKMLELLSSFPQHPNIIEYHGCRVRKGRVTGVYLGRVEGSNLWDHIQSGKTVDREPFLAALESAINQLHDTVGIAHNDIQPFNIMVSPDGKVPTLVDLGSSELIGEEISQCRMHTTWREDPPDMAMEEAMCNIDGEDTNFRIMSIRSRDLAALNKLRTWLDDPATLGSASMRNESMPKLNDEDGGPQLLERQNPTRASHGFRILDLAPDSG
ncbi:kinase-like domain-containing protein [Lasiosphaeris hirsuta]|uniref:Kinase-like domain-containing protein n=1 Tax=Lasiosphaeris hirsuta TaxID=260670 RepID=A0AA40AYI1_9PEZI|nr:kinase-like domain-containing protein [Lasiosphaeris hirsuta]